MTEQGTDMRRSRLLVPSMAGLWCFAALLTTLAVFSFVRGLGQLFLFSGAILLYGPASVEMDGFDRRLGQAIWSLTGPVIWGSAAGLCVAAARRMRARLNLTTQEDGLAPVVYLRSFRTDRRLSRRPLAIGRVFSWRTEEEQLVAVLREAGPVVAIGRPRERLPRLGARRVYVEEAEWRQQICSWFTRAALVVIHVSATPTEGLRWEIEQSLDTVALDRLVFLVPRGVSSLEWLNQQLRDRALRELHLKDPRRAPYGSGISGIVHFVDGHAQFRALWKPPFFRRPFFSPLVPAYRVALQPLTTRITGSWRPLAPAYGDAFIATVWIAFGLAVIAMAVDRRRTDPLDRDVLVCGRSVAAHLPAEALDLARKGDEAALSAWVQSRFHAGLRYIPDEAVVAQADAVGRLLAIAPPATCAEMTEGALARPAFTRILDELGKRDPAALRAWCDGQERALVASLASQSAEAFPISEAQVIAAFGLLMEGLSETDRERFARIVENDAGSSAEDRCWYARVMFHGIETLREPSRSTLARVGLGQDVDN